MVMDRLGSLKTTIMLVNGLQWLLMVVLTHTTGWEL